MINWKLHFDMSKRQQTCEVGANASDKIESYTRKVAKFLLIMHDKMGGCKLHRYRESHSTWIIVAHERVANEVAAAAVGRQIEKQKFQLLVLHSLKTRNAEVHFHFFLSFFLFHVKLCSFLFTSSSGACHYESQSKETHNLFYVQFIHLFTSATTKL